LSPRNALESGLQDRYRIERELGRGGFAIVYLAHDLRHDRSVALKVLHEEIAASIGVERFEREIKLAARLQHPHILSVFDSGEVQGRLWFAMPFIEGESLRDRLKRERQLPIAEAINIAREVADALDYAHSHGIVHRDIKPENILLARRHAMVADFGISRSFGAGDGGLTATGMSIGTPGYMSPEQATGERTLDARTDIFALGCVLYEMLAGEPPFTGPTAQAVIARMMTEAPRPIHTTRGGVSEALDHVTLRALSKVPADRFSTAAEMGDALAAAMTVPSAPIPSTTVATEAHPAAEPAPRGVIARLRSPIAAVFVLGVIIGLGGLFAWRSYSHTDAGGRGLAVLPFDNVGTPEDAAFADGITDEVRGKLAQIPGLRVTARTSSNGYKGTKKSPTVIGGELGVEYLLTGTIRWERAGDGQRRVRVMPELIRATDGSTKWQQPFDEALSDVFTVQSSIATQVAKALDVALGATVQQTVGARPTKNIEAYQEYLLGEKLTAAMTRNDAKSLADAGPHYDRAVALDTTFALAWCRVSLVATSRFSTNPTEELARRSQEALDRALQLARDNPQTRLAHSRYLRIIKNDFAGALAQLDTGLRQEPNNVDLLTAASAMNALLSKWDAAVEMSKRAYALDPRNPTAASSVGSRLRAIRQFTEAEPYYEKAMAIAPGNVSYLLNRTINRLSLGDLPGAQALVRGALRSVDSTTLAAYFALYQEMQWVLDEPLLRRIVAMTPAQFGNNRQQWALKVGATWNLLGDSARARVYGDSARIVAEAQLASFPNDAQLHELRARSLALAGNKPEAIAEAERALKMRETSVDATTGPYVRYQAARVFIQSGAYDRALDIIEPLMTTNYSDLTPGWLRLEPVFRALKGNPRFEKLIAKP
jgi:serine/threonine-protein kinase